MIIYVDGSCKSNGNPDAIGGFGVVAVDNDKIFTYNHQEIGTTNNRQELKAVLYAMFNFGEKNFIFHPTVYCDSAYVVNTLNDWMFRWADNNWLKSDNKKPENLDLIQAYYDYWEKGYRINLQKIKGHAGNKWNEMADKLAKGELKASYEWKSYGK